MLPKGPERDSRCPGRVPPRKRHTLPSHTVGDFRAQTYTRIMEREGLLLQKLLKTHHVTPKSVSIPDGFTEHWPAEMPALPGWGVLRILI